MTHSEEQAIPLERERRGGLRLVETAAALAPADVKGAALNELWRSHGKKLLRITFRITRNREDAEDALQDSFLRAFVNLEKFNGRSSRATWLTRIAINSALMIARKRQSGRDFSIDAPKDDVDSAEFETLLDRAPNPETRYVQSQREALLRESIQALSPKMRRAIELEKLQERSVKETAAIMGSSVPAVKSQVYHAKAAIRESLKSKFVRKAPGSARLQLQPAA